MARQVSTPNHRERSNALPLPLHPDWHPTPKRVDADQTDLAIDCHQLQSASSQSSVYTLVYPGGLSSNIQIEGSRSEIEPGAKLLSISHVEMKINTESRLTSEKYWFSGIELECFAGREGDEFVGIELGWLGVGL